MIPDELGTYLRVSTEKQAVNTSPERQLEENQAWAKKNLGFEIAHVFKEPGRTGANLDERPVMRHVLNLVETGQLRGVVFNTLDRTARNLDVLFRIRWIFLEAGARGFCVYEGLDITTKEFQELVGILLHGLKAQMELDDITRRLLGGREIRVKQGEAAGGGIVPYGFSKVRQPMPDGHAGIFFELNPEEVRVCHLIRDWFLEEGLSRRAIAARLHEWRIPSASASRRQKPGRWWPGIVGKILTDAKYRGRLTWGGHAISVPRIFSEEDAWRIDEQITENSKVWRHVRKYRYLLTGLLNCGQCGYTYTGTTVVHGGRPYGYYRCAVKQSTMPSDRPCNSPTLRLPEIERLVWENVRDLVLNPGVVNDLADYQRQHIDESLGEELSALQDEITRLEAEQDALIMMRVRGEIAQLDRLQKLLDEKEAEIAAKRRLQARYLDRQAQTERWEQELYFARQRMQAWHDMVLDPDLPFERRRAIARAVASKFVVEDESLVPYYSLLNPFLIDNHSVLTLRSSVKSPAIVLPPDVIVSSY